MSNDKFYFLAYLANKNATKESPDGGIPSVTIIIHGENIVIPFGTATKRPYPGYATKENVAKARRWSSGAVVSEHENTPTKEDGDKAKAAAEKQAAAEAALKALKK